MIALLANWSSYLYYGRGITFFVIFAILAAVRRVSRGRATKSTVPQQFGQQQYPQGHHPHPGQPQYPAPQFTPPAPPRSPFAGPNTNPLGPNDPSAGGPPNRPRSTPLP